MKTNKSKLMQRAWYLTRTFSYPFSYALKKVWAEVRAESERLHRKSEAEKEYERLKIWWSSPEFKELQRIENNKYKQFAADI